LLSGLHSGAIAGLCDSWKGIQPGSHRTAKPTQQQQRQQQQQQQEMLGEEHMSIAIDL
jgi:hypothetical protein